MSFGKNFLPCEDASLLRREFAFSKKRMISLFTVCAHHLNTEVEQFFLEKADWSARDYPLERRMYAAAAASPAASLPAANSHFNQKLGSECAQGDTSVEQKKKKKNKEMCVQSLAHIISSRRSRHVS